MSDSYEIDDEMAEFLQVFLDETGEQLDDLVETMLSLENQPGSQDDLNEAFRLIHSIKGSAGMMGLDNITALTHHLESRFECFRSGTEHLDEPTMNLVLRAVDYLRGCNDRLREGKRTESPADLLEELSQLEQHRESTWTALAEGTKPRRARKIHLRVRFREGLQLPDLKARLIATRLSAVGECLSSDPDLLELSDLPSIETFDLLLETDRSIDELHAITDVEGVESIECSEASSHVTGGDSDIESRQVEPDVDKNLSAPDGSLPVASPADNHPSTMSAAVQAPAPAIGEVAEGRTQTPDEPETSKVVETMRVDIERLDNLMNLTGELVVNRARFVQIASQISPAFRKASVSNRIREFCDGLRGVLNEVETSTEEFAERDKLLEQLRSGLVLMDEHVETWEQSRQQVESMTEAIDQLSLVSHSLQQGVFDTRMVPVGPLFSRFKRVVRDLSKERGKRVNLEIRGEKTELDKRMIDELGDPLVHLVRNSIDHGMESPQVRRDRGKAETGSIVLEATHSGNCVSIHVRDDGGGIDVEKIKAKIVQKGLLDEGEASQMSDDQALDYIWHPGFSTAGQVTDVSGRGVGMDVVRNRIRQLNGTIEVESREGQGTNFTLRLPLTLAIIRCLLVRLRGAVFSMPIEAVREIVSVQAGDVIQVHGGQAFEVRDEIIHLVGIDEIFHWHSAASGSSDDLATLGSQYPDNLEVVVLQMGGKVMGLKVGDLIGSQDMVIKSLADNFIDIRGLSGASILGDGCVCLMLDVGALFQLAKDRPTTGTKELAG